MADDIIQEVEESLKQEKLETLWKEYGSYLIAAVVLTVLLTGLFSGWNSWNSKANMAQTAVLIKALDSENKASDLQQAAIGLRPGQKVIARMSAAGILMDEGKKEEALMQYQEIAADREIEKVFRDLAVLMSVRLASSLESDEIDAANLIAQLQTIYKDASNPWQFHAHLQAAILQAHDLNNYQLAREHLQVVITATNTELPNSIKERARALDHVYALKAKDSAGSNNTDKNEDPEG